MCCLLCACVYLCDSYLYQPAIHTKCVFCTGESRRTRNKRTNCTYIRFNEHTRIKNPFSNLWFDISGTDGRKWTPGAPGVKVNAALFDMDPIILFISSHFKSTITA